MGIRRAGMPGVHTGPVPSQFGENPPQLPIIELYGLYGAFGSVAFASNSAFRISAYLRRRRLARYYGANATSLLARAAYLPKRSPSCAAGAKFH